MPVKIEGIPQLRKRLQEIANHVDGTRRQALAKDVAQVADEAAKIVQTAARANAAAQGWPAQLIGAIFRFSDPAKAPPRKRASLVGVRTGAKHRERGLYIEFFSKRLGRTIGVSLAHIYEQGTATKPPRPALKPAIDANRAAVRNKIRAGLLGIMEQFNKATP